MSTCPALDPPKQPKQPRSRARTHAVRSDRGILVACRAAIEERKGAGRAAMPWTREPWPGPMPSEARGGAGRGR